MGNRTVGSSVQGVRRTFVKLEGVLVYGKICIPRAHSYAVWLLPWVEALLQDVTLTDLIECPPWPVPVDPLVVRQLLHTLVDLRWAVPVWGRDGVELDSRLAAAFRKDGRIGLARTLFDAEVLTGEWWAEGLAGTVLSRQTAVQFDWDFRRRADHELQVEGEPQRLLDAREPDLVDLLRKLGGVTDLRVASNRAFLGTPLTAGDRKYILFTLVGDEVRLLPPELAELEPVLAAHAPSLLGQRKTARSRAVKLPASPVERLAAEVETFATHPAALGPVSMVRERVERLARMVEQGADALQAWLDQGVAVRPVLGPSQRHFDAVREMCTQLDPSYQHIILITSAFLNSVNAAQEDGLADALAGAPEAARVLVVYGHANDDPLQQQTSDIETWRAALVTRAPSLAGRVLVIAGRRRSHEKVVLTSAGDWMVGSWNAASSRPNATTFECSLTGRSRAFALQTLEHVAPNVEAPEAIPWISEFRKGLAAASIGEGRGKGVAVGNLKRAVGVLAKVGKMAGEHVDESWTHSIRAVRAALAPFLMVARLDLVDEQQTRDAFVALVRATKKNVLLASDRLAESGFDSATLRDLQGNGRYRRTVRVVWGREWAGRRNTDALVRKQLRRARRTVRDARQVLGESLRTREKPMENHAKLLIVDGQRGLVTSENLLSYGGEKGRHETRELGLLFWSPTVARHILGRMRLQWPDALRGDPRAKAEPPLPWIIAGNESWHALAAIRDELDFDWQNIDYLERVVEGELAADEPETSERRQSWQELVARVGRQPFRWVRDEGERLGLVAYADGQWIPYDATSPIAAKQALKRAEEAVARLTAEHAPSQEISVETETASVRVHPLVAKVTEEMVAIPPGDFMMGDSRVRDERPRHRVAISKPFLLGRIPVTQELWQSVMGSLPHLRDVERHPEFPIIHISYGEMQRFLERLNSLPGGGGFELPTEAQWEYACRAGSDGIYSFGDKAGIGKEAGRLEKFAWTKRNAKARLQRVGQLEPNAFGLYDMHGLVYETMRDGPRRYRKTYEVDPVGPLDGQRIVARGGFWGRFPVDPKRPWSEHFRCASRQVYEKSHRVSFRIARQTGGEW